MRHLARLGLVFTLASAGTALAAETISYVFVNDQIGSPGRQTVERSDDGLFTVHFIYKNNGRGPELAERFRLAPDGSFSEYHVKGTSTFGAVVDEHFERKGDSRRVALDVGERQATRRRAGAMYVPLNSSYAPLTRSSSRRWRGARTCRCRCCRTARCAAQARRGRGRARRREATRAAAGADRPGLSPDFFWATTGAEPRLFAY